MDPRDFSGADELHDTLAARHEDWILEEPEALEDPRRAGAWEEQADASSEIRPPSYDDLRAGGASYGPPLSDQVLACLGRVAPERAGSVGPAPDCECRDGASSEASTRRSFTRSPSSFGLYARRLRSLRATTTPVAATPTSPASPTTFHTFISPGSRIGR